jgi:hypothetical protein
MKTASSMNLRKLSKPTALFLSLLIILSMFSLFSATVLPVRAATPGSFDFGNTSIGALTNYFTLDKDASKFQLAQSGFLQSITVYFLTSGFNAKAAIYADDNGEPSTLIAQSASQAVAAGGWKTFAVPQTSLTAGYYWLCVVSDTSTSLGAMTPTSSNTHAWKYGSYLGEFTSSFGIPAGYQKTMTSIYATLSASTSNPAPTPSPNPTNSPAPTPSSSGVLTQVAVFSATASSYSGIYAPNLAIDGIESSTNYWGTMSALLLPQWLQLDLGSQTNICQITTHFYDGNTRAYTYYVEASVDGFSWTPVVSTKTGVGVVIDTFSQVTARYVRVTVTGNTANNAAHIEEIKVFQSTGTPMPTPTFSPTPSATPSPTATPPPSSPSLPGSQISAVTATASSYNGIYAALNAIDGIELTSNYWGTAAVLGLPQWLKIDLGSATSVSQVVTHFYDGNTRTYTYNIDTSTDGFSWTPVVSTKTGSGIVTDTFSQVYARYVRITVTGNTANNAAHIEEIKVFQSTGTPTPTPTPSPTQSPSPTQTPTPGGGWNGQTEFLIRDEIHTFSDNSPIAVENNGWHFWYDTSRYPENWYSPVNFWNGKIYTRWEILEQPTNTPCSIQVVWWKSLNDVQEELWDIPQHLSGGRGSVGQFSTVLSNYHVQGLGIDLHDTRNLWRQGIALIDDATGSPVTPPAWGYGVEPWNSRASWFPLKLRLTIVAVAEGAAFSGWSSWVSTPPTDGYS